MSSLPKGNRPQNHLETNLKRFLTERGMSVNALARRADVSTSTLHNYASGLIPQSIETVVKVASVLGKTPSELLFGPGVENDEVTFEITIKRKR